MFRSRPHMCERAREWASLRLDGELSDFERVLLVSHLSRCPECAAYVLEIGAITEAIRAAELEPLPMPVALPLRRRVAYASLFLRVGAAAAAAALALAVGLGTQLRAPGNSLSGDASATRLPVNATSGATDSEIDALVRLPRLANLKATFGSVTQGRLGIDT
jgi:anti-sigma factor RsiW